MSGVLAIVLTLTGFEKFALGAAFVRFSFLVEDGSFLL
jgi:hypothetical protein